jgi:hypothetical protein
MRLGTSSAAALTLALALSTAATGQDTATGEATAWQGSVLPQTEDIAALATGVAVGPDAIVAVGQRACRRAQKKGGDIGPCWGQPWISQDGITWEAVPAHSSGLDLGRLLYATSGPEIGVDGVAYGPAGYVAYGWAGTAGASDPREASMEAALWRSSDGRSWERVPSPEGFSGDFLMLSGPWLHDIAGTDAGYLLVGTIYGTPAPRAAIWSSPDGLEWTLAEDDAVFDVGAYIDTMEVPIAGGISDLAVAPGAADFAGAIAVGSVCPAAMEGAGPRARAWAAFEWTTGSCAASAWKTTDGVSWEAYPIAAEDASGRRIETSWADGVATSVDASVVGVGRKRLLVSEQSGAWTVAGTGRVGRQLALSSDDGGFHALVPRCTATHCRRRTLEVWSSPTGSTWDVDPTQPRMPARAEDFLEVDTAVFGDSIVVVSGYWAAPQTDLASMALLSPGFTTPGAAVPAEDAVAGTP